MNTNEKGTYVKLYRSLNNNEILANDNNAYVVFTRLLMLVDRHTGSYITGRKKLAVYMNLKDRTLYDVLKRLQRASMLRLESNSYATTIHICNWHDYQQDSSKYPLASRLKSNTKQEREEERETIYKQSSRETEYLQVLNEVTGRNFRVYPDEKRTRNTTKAFKPEEVRKALERMKLDDWHKPMMSKLSAGYLLATDNVDKFLNYKTVAEAAIGGQKAVPLDDRQQYKREYGVSA